MAASFGLDEGEAYIQKQLDFLGKQRSMYSIAGSQSLGIVRHSEGIPMDRESEATTTLAGSVNVGFSSPMPLQHHWFLRQSPHLEGAINVKNGLIRRKIEESLTRMPRNDEEALKLAHTALDNMLYRERFHAHKARREPTYYAPYIYDEVCSALPYLNARSFAH
jgi:hypothetical protein